MNYAAVYRYKGKLYIIYNGNDFGDSGFGYAMFEEQLIVADRIT